METSLKYSGDSKCIRFYAKEKLPISTNSICQLSGELDTKIGAPTYVNTMIRYFHPELSASLGFGVQYNRRNKLHYNVRAKKSFQLSGDGFLNFVVKGRCDIDEEVKKINYTGATELVWDVLNVKEDQDLRLKIGYNVIDKIPYAQIQESNWTLNFDGNRRWNVRYHL